MKQWSKRIYKTALEANPLAKYMGAARGKSADLSKPIIVDMDLAKAAGDSIQFDMFDELTGSGQTDDGTYETNEEALTSADMNVEIHERGHSVRIGGKMTKQRTQHDLDAIGAQKLGIWAKDVLCADLIAAASGLATKAINGYVTGVAAVDADSDAIETVNQVIQAQSATSLRYWAGGQTTAGAVQRVASTSDVDSATANLFGTSVISEVKQLAMQEWDSSGNRVGRVKPIVIEGQEFYILLTSHRNLLQLRKEAAWNQAQREANVRGKDNPIFSGMAGIWDGVIIVGTDLIHRRTGIDGTNVSEYFGSETEMVTPTITVCRSLLMGAEAMCLAYGQMPSFVKKDFEYDTQPGRHTDMIYGVKPTTFDFNSGTLAGTYKNIIQIDNAIV